MVLNKLFKIMNIHDGRGICSQKYICYHILLIFIGNYQCCLSLRITKRIRNTFITIHFLPILYLVANIYPTYLIHFYYIKLQQILTLFLIQYYINAQKNKVRNSTLGFSKPHFYLPRLIIL